MRRLLTVLCLLPSAVGAEEADCANIRSPVEEAVCSSDLDGSKRRLNAAYAVLAKKIDKEALPLLEKSQKAWLFYRNAQCDYEAEPLKGSTMVSSSRFVCVADMNRERASELEADLARWR